MNRLLLADLKRMWRQGLAISLLLGCGVAIFVMSNSSMVSLDLARDSYYRDYRFADIFAGLVRAPNRVAQRIGQIEGVQRVQARIVRDVLLDIPEMMEPASCRLVSIDTESPAPLNAIYLTRGRFPDDNERSEVIVSELFAEAHALVPGDSLTCILGGRKQTLRIVGVGLSPEFIYVVQPGMLITDDRRFGVVWMPRRQMEAAFNMEGAFNDLSIQLRPRANAQNVIHQIDRLTRKYGSTGAYDREDQPSHRRVADELSQMKTMAFVTPSIFLAVSAFLFNIVFTRLVNQQTEQIATLRAFGYRPSEIGWHYIKMVMFFVCIGSVIGWLLGMRLSWWMTNQYVRFFRFPDIDHQFATQHASLAVVAGATAALIGTFAAIRKAVALQPAVAMRPSAPRDYHGLLAERSGLSSLLSPLGRMVVRRLETNPLSTSLSVLGMSLAVSVLVLGTYLEDTVQYVMDFQFQKSQRQDVTLTFVETLSADAMLDAAHLPGVQNVEAFRSVPVRVRNGQRSYRLGLMGLDESPELFRVLDSQENVVRISPRHGLTISQALADRMQVEMGDPLTIEFLDRHQGVHEMEVTRVFGDFSSPSAYMHRQQLHHLMQEGEQYSGAYLSVEESSIPALYAQVKQTPTIAGVLDKKAAKESFEATISESTSLMRVVNAIFSGLIALGVIYNCAIIILAERARDLATLRVMGFRRREVSLVLIGELAAITLISIPIGLVIGYGCAWVTTIALDTETHRFPLIIQRSTYAYASAVILAASSVSALYVRRMLMSLDLVAVLKVKE